MQLLGFHVPFFFHRDALVSCSLPCMLLVYIQDWFHHEILCSTNGIFQTFFFFKIIIFAQILSGKGRQRNEGQLGLRAVHAVCPGVLLILASDFLKVTSSLWKYYKSGCTVHSCLQFLLLMIKVR